MGGGYISCGDFEGEDKSGSAINGVFDAIASMLPAEERRQWQSNFLAALEGNLEEQQMIIPSQLVRLLIDPLRAYYADLGAKLGNPHPADAPIMDFQRGLNPTEAKWGAG